MNVFDGSILSNNHALLAEKVWERLNPTIWPISINDLPLDAVLVGGAVRDSLLNCLSDKPDLDFVVPSGAIELTKTLADKYGGKAVVLDEQRFIARLVLKDWSFDFANQTGDSIENDLFRRDYRINSIALKLQNTPEIIDPLGGVNDLRGKKLVAISEINLIDDPLRLLRGIRFIGELNFSFDAKTKAYITKHKNLLTLVSPERVQLELKKLIHSRWADQAILILDEIPLLERWENKGQTSKCFNFSKENQEIYSPQELKLALFLNRLTQILSNKGLIDLRFEKKTVERCRLLRKWSEENKKYNVKSFNEDDRLKLHQELEEVLPAFISQLPFNDQKIWLKRWRDPSDPLFHPCCPVDGDTLLKTLDLPEGPLLGAIMRLLCKEKAFGRLITKEEVIEFALYLKQQKYPLL